ncbi:hypothetical protein N431DRAFT_159813 [Stipitochalara longipes BDJ]|nr:hypothetical protein N431DRAFT_159813 [Stipitochalara longipes BDJ]
MDADESLHSPHGTNTSHSSEASSLTTNLQAMRNMYYESEAEASAGVPSSSSPTSNLGNIPVNEHQSEVVPPASGSSTSNMQTLLVTALEAVTQYEPPYIVFQDNDIVLAQGTHATFPRGLFSERDLETLVGGVEAIQPQLETLYRSLVAGLNSLISI